MRCFTRIVAGLLPTVFLLSGCAQKLDIQKSIDIGPGEVKSVAVDGPVRDQEVTVIVSSTSPVDVFLVLEKEHKEAIGKEQTPKESLDKKEKVEKEVTLKAKIPAKNAYAVVVGNAPKQAKVSIQLKAQ